jgi:protein gp37
MRATNLFYDAAWSPFFGCSWADGPACRFCFAQARVPLLNSRRAEGYDGVIDYRDGVPMYNGHLDALPPEHRKWSFPFEYKGAAEPKLGKDKPSIIFAGMMGDLFEENRPKPIIDQVVGRLGASPHLGMLLSRRPERMKQYLLAKPSALQRVYQPGFLLGTSAEDQIRFNRRWPPMRELAQEGYFNFVNISPMMGPVTLPDDFLALARWVILYGEDRGLAPMHPDWARKVRDQCREAGIPFFLRQMSGKKRIPFDLHFRQFPRIPVMRKNPTEGCASVGTEEMKEQPATAKRKVVLRDKHTGDG